MNIKHNQLAITIIALVLLAQTLVFGTMAVFDYRSVKAELYQQLSQYTKNTHKRLSNSLPTLLWNFNDIAIRDTLGAEVIAEHIDAIAIVVDGKVEYQARYIAKIPSTENLLTEQQTLLLDTLKPTTMYYRGDDGEGLVGQLYVISSDQAIKQQLYKRVARLLLQSILLSVTLAVLIFFILYKFVIRPVHQISQGLQEIVNKGADLSQRLNESGIGELAELSNNYNKLADYVSTMLEEREQALNKAEESAKLKSEFLASMSHEIRTPMNGVLGMLDLMLSGKLNKQQRHYAVLAHSSASSLLVIINDILDFSKIEAGKLELEKLEFDLCHLMGELVESLAARAQDKGLEIILDLEELQQTVVYSDPSRLRQILTNIIGNAIKFTETGEILIHAQLSEENHTHCTFHCNIVDTGIGIPEEKQHLLFESFSQVDASTTREYGGTGLGLAIVKQLCSLMNGDISVESTINKGSCFRISLPVEKSSHSKTTLLTGNKRLLLVEPNHSQKRAIVKQLSAWQYHVDTLENIKALTKHLDIKPSYDLLIISMQTTNKDHIKTLEHIEKQFPQQKKACLLSLSDMSQTNVLKPFDFTGKYAKPITLDDYENLLNTAFNCEDINSPSQESNNATASHSDKRILLVEDNIINQQIALANLEALGLQADLAENGLEAIELLKTKHISPRYNLILMDCQMPEMDGYQATQNIRRGKANNISLGKAGDVSMIPIIAMTANAMKGDREKCIASGMDDYISKPIDPEALETLLNKWLD